MLVQWALRVHENPPHLQLSAQVNRVVWLTASIDQSVCLVEDIRAGQHAAVSCPGWWLLSGVSYIYVAARTCGLISRDRGFGDRPADTGGYCPSTYIRQVILKRCLLSRIALRLLKIIEPYLVKQNRMANAQLLMYGSKHLEQNFFVFCFSKEV